MSLGRSPVAPVANGVPASCQRGSPLMPEVPACAVVRARARVSVVARQQKAVHVREVPSLPVGHRGCDVAHSEAAAACPMLRALRERA